MILSLVTAAPALDIGTEMIRESIKKEQSIKFEDLNSIKIKRTTRPVKIKFKTKRGETVKVDATRITVKKTTKPVRVKFRTKNEK